MDLTQLCPGGSRIWYTATIVSDVISFATDEVNGFVGDLKTYLENQYQITIESSNVKSGLVTDSTVLLQLLVNGSFDSFTTVQKIIDDGWYNATSWLNRAKLQSSSITKIQLPNQQTGQATGAPGPSQSGAPTIDPSTGQPKQSGFLSDLWDALFGTSSSSSGLSVTGWITLGAVALFAIVIAGVIISPTAPARVARSFSQ